MALKFVFNPVTGQLDYIDETAPAGVGSYNIDKVTLNATDITNKQITLSGTPSTATDTRLVVIGGIEQDYGVDFSVSGTTLTWSSLGLDGVLANGDKIIVIYN